MSDRPVLTTSRLVIRPADESDADALHPLYADADVMRWWSHPPHDTIEQTRARVGKDLAAPDGRMWAITRPGEDAAIGALFTRAKRPGVAEIGYLLSRDAWGAGLGREAVAALLDKLFGAEAHRRVFADTDPDNLASNRLLERLGFTLEGQLRAEWETHLGVRDSLIWGLLRDEWLAKQLLSAK